jgi:hypothetical protein
MFAAVFAAPQHRAAVVDLEDRNQGFRRDAAALARQVFVKNGVASTSTRRWLKFDTCVEIGRLSRLEPCPALNYRP